MKKFYRATQTLLYEFLVGKQFWNILARGIVLFVISYSLSFWYFSHIENILRDEFVRTETSEGNWANVREELIKKTVALKDFEESVAVFTRLPSYFLRYKIYAQNNVILYKEKSKESDKVELNMDVDIQGEFTNDIKGGETKQVFDKSISLNEYNKYPITFSLQPAEDYKNPLYLNDKEDSFSFFPKPTLMSRVIGFVISTAIFYAFLAFVSKILEFILVGLPFSEVTKKYKE